jgi:hypothetical protein
MTKVKTSLSIDEEDRIKMSEAGISPSKLLRHAVALVLSDSFDDYRRQLKVKLIADDLNTARREHDSCVARLEFLDLAIPSLEQSLKDAERELEVALTVGRLSVLTQELNRCLIVENYETDVIMRKYGDIVREIVKLNPGFSLEKHRDRIMKIMGY